MIVNLINKLIKTTNLSAEKINIEALSGVIGPLGNIGGMEITNNLSQSLFSKKIMQFEIKNRHGHD
ncbi:MAG: hypothetical protein CMP38_03575 [Rickettsiales bacterium]|nr:hypothetical protein [Rickettsiales bacterium]|tara:strand:+ start:2908 stop:3105 length:198 start_codon:yes stop_codon:yes gene_type:complete